jgi:hypothetical protein
MRLEGHHHGDGVMPKGNQAGCDAAEDISANRMQDENFCRALRAALWAGTEFCPEGVSKAPSTKKPILNYHPPD